MGKIKNLLRNKWVGFTLAALLYTLWFVVWTGNLWLLLGLPVIFDLYITKFFYRYVWSHNVKMCQRSKTYQHGVRMGQRHHLRDGRGDAGASIHLPNVRHPHLVDGADAAHRRLSLREQGGLRTADAQHAAVVPLRTPHDALLADQEIVLRGDQVALPPPQGAASRYAATTWWSSTSRRATRCCSKTRT